MPAPRTTTVHGHTILDRKPCPVPGSEYVVAHLEHNACTPFVVWRMEKESGICEGGQYVSDLATAADRLRTRH